MEDTKTLKVLQEVLDKTRAGKIKWEPSALESEYFAVLPGGFIITIQGVSNSLQSLMKSFPGSGSKFTISFTISKDDDEIVEIPADPTNFERLHALYELARAQASRLDPRVDEFLGALAKM